MTSPLRSELLKQRTLRLPVLAIAAAAVTGALSATALITTAGQGGNPPLDSHSLIELAHGPFALVAYAALLLGILGTAGEFRHETITATLLVVPGRVRLVAAKVLVHAGVGAVLALAACTLSLAVSVPWLHAQHVPIAGAFDVAPVVLGGVAAAAIFGAAGSGLGVLLANQTAAVTASLVWLLAVEGLVVGLTSTSGLHSWLPGGAVDVVAKGGTADENALAFWSAAGLGTAHACALVAAGARRFVGRDIT
jgi:ABC-2 type transport system permease protein